jgi:hypothetical protein
MSMIGEGIRSEARNRLGRKVVVPALASLVIFAGCGGQNGTSSAESRVPTTSTSGNNLVKFQFDNLGSTYPGSEYVQVYPGPLDTPADRKKNGTFNNKDIVTAICVATGRKLTPDPNYHESSRPDDVQDKWIKVSEEPAQFASLTYGELVPVSAELPACTDVQ